MKSCENEQLEELWYIMYALSDTMFSKPEVSRGEKGTYMLSSESVMSTMNTIVSIDFCCQKGFFSDAFTLVRKYRDDLFQYLFLLNVVSSVRGMSEEELSKYDITDIQSFMEMFEKEIAILDSGERKTDREKAVEAWFFGNLIDEQHKKDRRKYFDTSKYKNYLADSNDKVSFMMKNYFEDIWENVDRVLNNYVHANGYGYITANYIQNVDKKIMLDKVVKIMQDITSMFLCVLAMIDALKMQSMDYIDALDCGMRPVEESKYWILPGIVDYMEKCCKPIHPNLLQYIEDNNGYGMKFFVSDYDIGEC